MTSHSPALCRSAITAGAGQHMLLHRKHSRPSRLHGDGVSTHSQLLPAGRRRPGVVSHYLGGACPPGAVPGHDRIDPTVVDDALEGTAPPGRGPAGNGWEGA